MIRTVLALALASALAAPAAFAQGQQQRPAQSAQQPAAQPAPQQPSAPVPQPLPETFDKWQVGCVQDVKGKQACQMQQVLRKDDVFQIAVFVKAPAEAGQRPVGTIVPPWAALLARGVDMQVDNGQAVRVPLRICLPAGCIADFTLVEALETQMQKGTTLKLTIANASGQAVSFDVPLAGFSRAYARMMERSR